MLTLSSETVFYTIQGEGKYIGYPSVFIRTSGCNLRCSWKNLDGSTTICDTPHTSFKPEESVKVTVDKAIDLICQHKCDKVVVTGGEPYMQKEIVELINRLHDMGKHVTVETNGTLFRESKADFVSISQKLSSSSNGEFADRHEKNRFNIESLSNFISKSPDYQLKFVVNTVDDIEEIQDLVKQLEIRTGLSVNDKVWLMPQGIENRQFDEKLVQLVDICKENSWKLTDRFHVRIWGHMRGV